MARRNLAEIKIDWDLVRGMARTNAPAEEIVKVIGYRLKTLNLLCKRDNKMPIHLLLERQYALFRQDIRTAQILNAQQGKGNATMLKWIGKQYLGQSEAIHELNKRGDAPEETKPTGFELVGSNGKVIAPTVTEIAKDEVKKEKDKQSNAIEQVLKEESKESPKEDKMAARVEVISLGGTDAKDPNSI